MGAGGGGGNGDRCVRAEGGALLCTHSVNSVCLTYVYILRTNKGEMNPHSCPSLKNLINESCIRLYCRDISTLGTFQHLTLLRHHAAYSLLNVLVKQDEPQKTQVT